MTSTARKHRKRFDSDSMALSTRLTRRRITPLSCGRRCRSMWMWPVRLPVAVGVRVGSVALSATRYKRSVSGRKTTALPELSGPGLAIDHGRLQRGQQVSVPARTDVAGHESSARYSFHGSASRTVVHRTLGDGRRYAGNSTRQGAAASRCSCETGDRDAMGARFGQCMVAHDSRLSGIRVGMGLEARVGDADM